MTQNEKAARKKKIMHVIMWIVLLILFICFVAPFILVVINVFKTKGDITSNPLSLVGEHGFTLKNFPAGHEEDELLAGLYELRDHHGQRDDPYHRGLRNGILCHCP